MVSVSCFVFSHTWWWVSDVPGSVSPGNWSEWSCEHSNWWLKTNFTQSVNWQPTRKWAYQAIRLELALKSNVAMYFQPTTWLKTPVSHFYSLAFLLQLLVKGGILMSCLQYLSLEYSLFKCVKKIRKIPPFNKRLIMTDLITNVMENAHKWHKMKTKLILASSEVSSRQKWACGGNISNLCMYILNKNY